MPGDRIAVVGATGATGRRVVELGASAGLQPIAVGRRREGLEELASRAGGEVEVRVASLSAEHLDRALAGAGVVVCAVGPTTAYGAAIVEAALRAGAHYIDFSGEPRWVHEVAVRYAPVARERGCVLVPSAGLNASTDIATRRACAELSDVATLVTALRIRGMRPSVATTRSTLEIIASGGPTADRGGIRWLPAGGVVRGLPGGTGIGWPLPEPIVLHLEWPEAEIRSYVQPPMGALMGPALTAYARIVARRRVLHGLRGALTWWADRSVHGHDHAGGGEVTGTAVATSRGGERRTARVHVRDAYDVTARAGFAAATGLLSGTLTSGMASWGAAVGDLEAAVRAVGAQLDPVQVE